MVIVTDQSVRQTLHKLETFGRLVKWAIELSEFDISYQCQIAIKVQAMVDFVAEFTEPNVDPIHTNIDANNNMGQI